MNVAELIEKLSEFDPAMRVVVNGYETGFNVVNSLRVMTVQPWQPTICNDEREDYEGELRQCKEGEQGEQVVWFPRNSSNWTR
jgi:hypothetical protein